MGRGEVIGGKVRSGGEWKDDAAHVNVVSMMRERMADLARARSGDASMMAARAAEIAAAKASAEKERIAVDRAAEAEALAKYAKTRPADDFAGTFEYVGPVKGEFYPQRLRAVKVEPLVVAGVIAPVSDTVGHSVVERQAAVSAACAKVSLALTAVTIESVLSGTTHHTLSEVSDWHEPYTAVEPESGGGVRHETFYAALRSAGIKRKKGALAVEFPALPLIQDSSFADFVGSLKHGGVLEVAERMETYRKVSTRAEVLELSVACAGFLEVFWGDTVGALESMLCPDGLGACGRYGPVGPRRSGNAPAAYAAVRRFLREFVGDAFKLTGCCQSYRYFQSEAVLAEFVVSTTLIAVSGGYSVPWDWYWRESLVPMREFSCFVNSGPGGFVTWFKPHVLHLALDVWPAGATIDEVCETCRPSSLVEECRRVTSIKHPLSPFQSGKTL